MLILTKQQAKRFILAKQGLLGPHRFHHEAGILDYVKQAGCLQFDPLDICGRNPDLVLFSRVAHYDKTMLDNLLYNNRKLVDQWDKNMAIHLVEDWPFLSRIRALNAQEYEEQLKGLETYVTAVKAVLQAKDYITHQELDIHEDAHFFTWRHRKLSQAILDYLFFKGEVVIHHREGVKRYFGLSTKYLPAQVNEHLDPFRDEASFHQFQILRRISAVGMLASGSSDAYLGIYHLSTKERIQYFAQLVEQGLLVPCQIQGLKETLYILKTDEKYLDFQIDYPRVEFIAPLDNFLWDRKLIKKIFDYSYTWEIYTPASKRKYGAYVLPILYQDDLVGRIEMSVDRKNKILNVKNIWFEHEVPGGEFQNLLQQRLSSFAAFNDCQQVDQKNTQIYTNFQ